MRSMTFVAAWVCLVGAGALAQEIAWEVRAAAGEDYPCARWSPDGTKVWFVVFLEHGGGSVIRCLRPDGKPTGGDLDLSGAVSGFDLGPDGTSLLFPRSAKDGEGDDRGASPCDPAPRGGADGGVTAAWSYNAGFPRRTADIEPRLRLGPGWSVESGVLRLPSTLYAPRSTVLHAVGGPGSLATSAEPDERCRTSSRTSAPGCWSPSPRSTRAPAAGTTSSATASGHRRTR